MPSVAQESPTVQSAKKRRRDDNTHQIPLATNTPRGIFADKTFHHGDLFHHSSPSAPRKIIPLPPGKRQRTTVDIDVIDADGEPMQRSPPTSPPQRHRHHPQQQRDHQQQTNKGGAASREDHLDDRIAPLMSRCHICSRRPNKKADLDSFADCQGCGQRTCYVCIRECLGWGGGGPKPNMHTITETQIQTHTHNHNHNHPATPSEPRAAGETSFTMLDADDAEQQQPPPQCHDMGRTDQEQQEQEQGWTRGGGHRRVVCSRCCVERGRDGEVVCLGCLPFVEG
ncbi:hypothetical protein C8A01DRAFT_16714 [Parachaetomium inaequale]|uniref:Uncharacterized protein n=1 Tax=Parachaetomium inaequale TaxID=2588326 RepID=A0AAN6PE49_9PEZI|nr:hypothetical protein C8A01DRAFT_16714 [Parachaetomium inaequale]